MIDIQVGKRYRNIKTRGVYLVLTTGLAAWDSEQCLVIYQRVDNDDQTVWVRSRNEFVEKFEEMSSNEI